MVLAGTVNSTRNKQLMAKGAQRINVVDDSSCWRMETVKIVLITRSRIVKTEDNVKKKSVQVQIRN